MPPQLRRYSYPNILIPIDGKLHPDTDAINEEVRRWAFHYKLHEKEPGAQQYKREQIVRLACHCYPDGDYERTLLVAKYMVTVFVLDDTIEARKQGKYFSSLMKHGRSYHNLAKLLDQTIYDPETPITVSFAEFWKEVKKLSNETWQNRFAENYIWYLKANTWEDENKDANRVPPLAEYLEYRHYSSGVDPSFNLIELSRNISIPDSVLVNPTLQRLSYIAGNVVAFVNDVFSFEKERKVGEINNLVTVLKHEFDISYQEAIEMAVKMANEEVKKYLALEPFIPSFGIEMDKYVNMYLEGLRDWMRGNFDWSCSSGRYIRLSYPEDEF